MAKTSRFQYPISYTKDEVPLWVSLKNRAYSGLASLRAFNREEKSLMLLTEKLDIKINLPKEFTFNDRGQYNYGYSQLLGMDRAALGAATELVPGVEPAVRIMKRGAGAVGWVDVQATDAVFQGSDLRKFHFTFDMVPKTIEEAQHISKLCKAIRKQVYPMGTATSDIFGAIHPPLWEIEIIDHNEKKAIEWDLNFQPTVLTECIIDKMPEGPRAISNKDASVFSPSATKLTLVFFELEPNYFDHVHGVAVARSKLTALRKAIDAAMGAEQGTHNP
jgi:hypothetical protein